MFVDDLCHQGYGHPPPIIIAGEEIWSEIYSYDREERKMDDGRTRLMIEREEF